MPYELTELFFHFTLNPLFIIFIFLSIYLFSTSLLVSLHLDIFSSHCPPTKIQKTFSCCSLRAKKSHLSQNKKGFTLKLYLYYITIPKFYILHLDHIVFTCFTCSIQLVLINSLLIDDISL